MLHEHKWLTLWAQPKVQRFCFRDFLMLKIKRNLTSLQPSEIVAFSTVRTESTILLYPCTLLTSTGYTAKHLLIWFGPTLSYSIKNNPCTKRFDSYFAHNLLKISYVHAIHNFGLSKLCPYNANLSQNSDGDRSVPTTHPLPSHCCHAPSPANVIVMPIWQRCFEGRICE